jgi:hypothetical protein
MLPLLDLTAHMLHNNAKLSGLRQLRQHDDDPYRRKRTISTHFRLRHAGPDCQRRLVQPKIGASIPSIHPAVPRSPQGSKKLCITPGQPLSSCTQARICCSLDLDQLSRPRIDATTARTTRARVAGSKVDKLRCKVEELLAEAPPRALRLLMTIWWAARARRRRRGARPAPRAARGRLLARRPRVTAAQHRHYWI